MVTLKTFGEAVAELVEFANSKCGEDCCNCCWEYKYKGKAYNCPTMLMLDLLKESKKNEQ